MNHMTYEQFYSLDPSFRGRLTTARGLAEEMGYTSIYISALAREGKIKPVCVVSLSGRSKRPCHYFDKEKVLKFFEGYNALKGRKEKHEFIQSYWA